MTIFFPQNTICVKLKLKKNCNSTTTRVFRECGMEALALGRLDTCYGQRR